MAFQAGISPSDLINLIGLFRFIEPLNLLIALCTLNEITFVTGSHLCFALFLHLLIHPHVAISHILLEAFQANRFLLHFEFVRD